MTSLAEAYAQSGRIPRRLYVGTSLFVAGAVLVIVGIVFATTELFAVLGLDVFGARRIAGVTAGLGVPAVFVGAFTVLPARKRERAAAAIGASTAVFGVFLFWYAYPEQWYYPGVESHLTPQVVVVYFFGTITTFWAMFTALVDLKTRTPGGTVTLQHIIGERPIEPPSPSTPRPSSSGSMGGVGVFGDVDRDSVATSEGAETLASPASDGGTTASEIRTPAPEPDRYCGNCSFFDYLQTDDGMQPYCGFSDEQMDDMEACEHWESNA